jgi:serine/threonine-protein kinase
VPLSIGDSLGPYQILSPIGEGGMGEVWKAHDTRLNRIVAIKQLKEQHSARFRQEARTIAALNHPHICQIYDVGPDYLVLEFVEGAPLQGPLGAEQALPLALQMASALEAAHKRGILHRDLKPGNVMVTEAGAKLLDFGLAKLANNQDADATCTVQGLVSGTPAYMSPEQAQSQTVDERSDIFSLGAVLYELLSGRRAFGGNSLLDVLNAVVRNEPTPLDSPLSAVVKRCLAKDPAQRFQSATELKAALVQAQTKSGTQPPSIAVLPFVNMSRDADDEFFSDGLAEEIINALVKVPGLKVIARTSAFAFKGQNIDIRKIAEILGVTNVLEGSVRRAGNRIRITAQLITAADGSHLWSERYDRQMDDLFAMQDEIAAAIASELKLKFSPPEHARRQPNLQAYEAYLRYRQYQWLFTPTALTRSRECLEQAIALDPQFALPYAGLADHYFATTTFGNAGELVPKARTLAERALELDADLPEAHGMLGLLAAYWNPDWKEAERRFRLATAREPVPWHVRSWYSSFYLRPMGDCAESRRQAERALEDNPLSQLLHWSLGNQCAGGGSEADALTAYERAVELDPQFWIGLWSLGLHHAVCGRLAEARVSSEKAVAIYPHPYNMGLLAGVLRKSGEAPRVESLLQQISDGAAGRSLGLASFHLAIGEIDEALEWAAKALAEGYPMTGNMFLWPFERTLRQGRGWPGLMKKFNLPETR